MSVLGLVATVRSAAVSLKRAQKCKGRPLYLDLDLVGAIYKGLRIPLNSYLALANAQRRRVACPRHALNLAGVRCYSAQLVVWSTELVLAM